MTHHKFFTLVWLVSVLMLFAVGCTPSSTPAIQTTSPATQTSTPAEEIPSASPAPTLSSPTPTLMEISTPNLPESPDQFAVCQSGAAAPGVEAPNILLAYNSPQVLNKTDLNHVYSGSLPEDTELIQVSEDASLIVYAQRLPENQWRLRARDSFEGVDRDLVQSGSLVGELRLGEFSFDKQLIWFGLEFPDGGGELWVARTDGSGSQKLVSREDFQVIVADPEAVYGIPTNVLWIPNTYQLLFDAYPQFDTEGLFIYIQEQVYVADAQSGKFDVYLPIGEGGQVVFSPDGTEMLVRNPDQLKAMNVEARNLHALEVPYQAIGMGEFYAHPALLWLPEGNAVLLAQPDPEFAYEQDGPVSIFRVPLDGSPAEEVEVLNGFFASFVFSPDGNQVAYWSAPPLSNERQLRVAQLIDGEGILLAAGDLIEFHSWSPDSRHYLYLSDFSDNRTLTYGDLCAGEVETLEGLSGVEINWLDEQNYLVKSFFPESLGIYLGKSDGGVQKLLELQTPAALDFGISP